MSLQYIALDTQEKSLSDWRSFLYFILDDTQIELRGYGNTEDKAREDALSKYNDPVYMEYIYNIEIEDEG